MALETERKFLVIGDSWRSLAEPIPYLQGYLSRENGVSVRIRIAGERAFLTVKGPVNGISRDEFEYSVPLGDAQQIMQLAGEALIEKTRRRIPHGRHVWEVDEFSGANQGLIVAEVELSDPLEQVEFPDWIGKEVTGDPRYYNSRLTIHPYRNWKP